MHRWGNFIHHGLETSERKNDDVFSFDLFDFLLFFFNQFSSTILSHKKSLW